MQPSIWTDAFVELEAEEAVERMAAIGWRTLELAEIHWRRIEQRDDPERHVRTLRRQADDLGIAFAQIHGLSYDFWAADADVAAGLEWAKRSLNYSAILGVQQYVFHPCAGNWSDGAGAREARRDIVGQLADLARPLGVGVAVENMPGSASDRRWFGAVVDELLWLAEQTDPAVVGVCWDTGHAHMVGLDQYEALTALGPHLRATHIQDNDGTADQHRLPYEGSIDWAAVLRALREIGYPGAFNLEIGGAVHATPLPIRPAKVRYALELTAAMLDGRV